MQKLRKRLKRWQQKHPRLNDLFPYTIGTILGFTINMFTNDVAESKEATAWHWIGSIWLWVSIVVFILGLTYYILFGSYKADDWEEKTTEEFHKATIQRLKSAEISYEEKCDVLERHDKILGIDRLGGVRK